MTRAGLGVAAAVWLAALAATIAMSVPTGSGVAMHGYFAGWLAAISLPLGALPVLMVLDLLGASETPERGALRLLLAALPVMALLIVPALFDLGGIFPWRAGSAVASAAAEAPQGFARSWYAPAAFGLRAVVYLVIWCALALFFVRPAPPSRRHLRVAGLGLAVHAVIGTLAAYDWWMSLDAGFTSSGYGVLVMTVQASFALAVATLLASFGGRHAAPDRPILATLLGMLALAAFVQFAQYLVVWSANLPREIAWYQARWTDPLGPLVTVGLPLLLAVAAPLLIPNSLPAMRKPAMVGLVVVLLVAFLDLACLASPRGTFTIGGVGLTLAFLVVIGGLGAVCAVFLGGRIGRDAKRV